MIDEANIILAGNGTRRAALELGWDKIFCVRSDLENFEKMAFALADNRTAELASWDMPKLEEQLKMIDEPELIGFDDEFISLDDDLSTPEQDEKEDDIPEVDDNPYGVKRGDIWKLGKHRLMCGDSTNENDISILTNGSKIDLWITDPPYNVDYQGKTKDALKIQNDSMNDEEFRIFLAKVYQAADIVMKPGASFYIWHADSEGYNFRGAAIDVGWKIRQCLIWVKDTMVMGRQDYHWKHEPCLYGWKKGASHKWVADRKQTTLLEFDRPKRSEIHPTMKPISLFEYQVRNNTEKGDLVLDSFCGSGTTIITCEKTNRIGYGMEIDPHFCSVIIKRWEEYTGEKAERIK